MKRVWLICVLSLAVFCAKAQSFFREHFYICPSVTLGYTLGARVTYGVDLDLGYAFKDKNGALYRTGFSVSQYFVEAKHHTARILTASVMFQKDLSDIKAGVGRLRNKWGYENRNTSATYGFSYDLSLRLPENFHNTWIGLRHFVYKPSDWPWFEMPYTSAYLKYKYNIIKPASNDPEGRKAGSSSL